MTRNPRRAYDGQGAEIPPMPLDDMREHGARSISAYCEAIGCDHEATINVDGLPEELPVPDVALRLRCLRCRSRKIYTRPNWSEMRAAGMGHDA